MIKKKKKTYQLTRLKWKDVLICVRHRSFICSAATNTTERHQT